MNILIYTFLTVGLLGFQQLNVTHHKYKMAAITSFCIAAAQYSMIVSIQHGGSWLLMGVGGAAGVTSSMFLHKRMREWIK